MRKLLFKPWMESNAKQPRNKAILIWATFNASDSSIHELIIFMSKWTALCIIFPCAQQKRGRKKGKSPKVECKKCHFNSVLSVSFAKYRQFWNISPFSHILWSQFVYYGKTSNGKRSHLQMVILAISNLPWYVNEILMQNFELSHGFFVYVFEL